MDFVVPAVCVRRNTSLRCLITALEHQLQFLNQASCLCKDVIEN